MEHTDLGTASAAEKRVTAVRSACIAAARRPSPVPVASSSIMHMAIVGESRVRCGVYTLSRAGPRGAGAHAGVSESGIKRLVR